VTVFDVRDPGEPRATAVVGDLRDRAQVEAAVQGARPLGRCSRTRHTRHRHSAWGSSAAAPVDAQPPSLRAAVAGAPWAAARRPAPMTCAHDMR